mgnify:CR=1 FL=1
MIFSSCLVFVCLRRSKKGSFENVSLKIHSLEELFYFKFISGQSKILSLNDGKSDKIVIFKMKKGKRKSFKLISDN